MRWFIFTLLTSPAFADCPAAPPDIDAPPLRVLIDEARAATDERAARAVTGDMWALWTRARMSGHKRCWTRGGARACANPIWSGGPKGFCPS